MCYHEIETGLRLHEFGIQDGQLKRQITKIVITRILYTFQWNFTRKTKIEMGDPYINSDCDEIFVATICHQKVTLQVFPEYIY